MHRFYPSGCGVCGSEDRRFFHAVRLVGGGILRHLCTLCVLKSHLDSFCPVCFDVFEKPSLSLSIERVQCSKCRSKTHVSCIISTNSASNFLCPLCSNASALSFFDDWTKKAAIDAKAAKVLVAAARIASDSMRRAAAAARMEAERRVKEAAFARKRAVGALERLASLSAQEEMKKKQQQQQKKKKKLKGDVGKGLKNGVFVNNVVRMKKSSCSIGNKAKGHVLEGKKKKKKKKVCGDSGGLASRSKFGGVGKESSNAEC